MSDRLKYILQSYDPERMETAPDELRQAVEQSREDAELKAFMDAEVAFDQAFKAKLAETPAPAGLKERILAQAALSAVVDSEALGRKSWWRSAGFMSLAASIVILLGIMTLFTQTPVQALTSPKLNAFIDGSVDFSNRIDNLMYADDLQAIIQHLQEQQSPYPQYLPQAIHALSGVGCRPVEINGVQASLICVSGDLVYHLYVANRADFPDQQDLAEAFRRQCGDFATATWTSESQVFVLTAQGEEKCLDTLFK